MSVYGWFGTIIFWAAGFRISIKGKQAPRSEAPILVGAPHSSFLEALIIYMCGSSPVSRHENKTAFLISACQIFYQAIFVDRLVMHLLRLRTMRRRINRLFAFLLSKVGAF